ncbi:mitochondrial splicing system protein [Mycoemilia scoparia]|uniref:Mitochondrial splicing system protein n=1 Tax=Mycoemilia scoparia TaxID=417184 RepID=A0A9W8A3S7_9FUNG|nr:mitochondrial splicing system protein [Mycoemilia scoparia]
MSLSSISSGDTIYALSTSPGKAGIAVVRISGPQAKKVIGSMTRGLGHKEQEFLSPRQATLRRIVSYENPEDTIDIGIVIYFPGPKSFTGEDTVELQLHGGNAVVVDTLESLNTIPGFRMAEPGEFSRRAFENERLDLTSLEGLADLINAETKEQRKQALRQAEGGLKKLYDGWREEIIHLIAQIEAVIDFSEEENIEDAIYERAQRQVAIVSPQAGTTRDIIETTINIGHYPVVVADTAGIRGSDDLIEIEGIKRAIELAKNSDIRVCIFDVKSVTEAADKDADSTFNSFVQNLNHDGDTTLVLFNKWDQLAPLSSDNSKTTQFYQKQESMAISLAQKVGIPSAACCPISCMEGWGWNEMMKVLSAEIRKRFASQSGESIPITRARHRKNLNDSLACLDAFLALPGDMIVLAAEELRASGQYLGRITGKVDIEDVLDALFSQFCIGK